MDATVQHDFKQIKCFGYFFVALINSMTKINRWKKEFLLTSGSRGKRVLHGERHGSKQETWGQEWEIERPQFNLNLEPEKLIGSKMN